MRMRKGNYRSYFYCAVFLIFFNSFCIPSLCAATINIDQSKIRHSIAPGNSRSGFIEVQNFTPSDIMVRAYLEDWTYSRTQDGTKNFYPPGTMPRSAASWISFVPSEFLVPANSSQRVNYTVKVPKDASGAAFAVLFFESIMGRQTIQDAVGMNVTLRIGSLFYIEVEGSAVRQADIGDFSFAYLSDEGASEISLDLKNTGTSDIIADAQFHIMDNTGMVFDRGQFPPAYTLPGDSVRVSAKARQKLKPGVYSLVITIDLGKALKDLGLPSGPIIVKETSLSVSPDGTVTQKGEFK